MHPRDWQQFLKIGAGREIACAQLLSDEVLTHLEPASDKLFIGHDAALKAVTKHHLAAEHFPLIFDTVERGMALADKDRHVTFLHETELGWFQVTVKCALASRRLYVATFYRTRERDVRSKRRRFLLLRDEKRAAGAARITW